MAKRKVLYICHNHPMVRPGGAEGYALELHEALRTSAEFEPIFLARTASPIPVVDQFHQETLITPIDKQSGQYFIHSDEADYDWFFGTSRNKKIYTKHFREFLVTHQPDIVHFQHSLFLGYDLIRETKNTLPDAPIIYTLHEFLPICHRKGQLMRTNNEERCLEASPRRCHECFPGISPQNFFIRRRFIQSHFSLVDLFIAPSKFLLERYVEWGIPREKIRFEDYGRLPVSRVADSKKQRARNRFGFFGQLNFFKGVNVLLEAMKILGEDKCDVHLWLHGANLEHQPKAFQKEFSALLEAARQNVTLVGCYDHTELRELMAKTDWIVVPSIWWENSPLVIQEAFLYGRPVICSDIGGMAEKVTHGVNGLHFRAGDAIDLAQTIRQASSSQGLWETLRSGIHGIYKMDDHVTMLTGLYRAMLNGADSRK